MPKLKLVLFRNGREDGTMAKISYRDIIRLLKYVVRHDKTTFIEREDVIVRNWQRNTFELSRVGRLNFEDMYEA